MSGYNKIACILADKAKLQEVCNLLKKYNFIDIEQNPKSNIDLLVVIGGDGFMLHSLHNYIIGIRKDIPVYGINYGTVGFLLNKSLKEDLIERINKAVTTELVLLKMKATDINGEEHCSTAVNEISLLRKTNQAVHIKITINNKSMIKKLIADGIMLSTPAGSTAYNFSAGGPILPLNSNLFALTPISPFRPRRWRGALLPNDALVELEIIDSQKRPATVVSDYMEFKNISKIEICKDLDNKITLLFDDDHSLDKRILREQFLLRTFNKLSINHLST